MRILLPFLVNAILNFIVGLVVAKLLGPAEYGRYALALSIGVVIQISLFEWLRLSALRFYSDHDRAERPDIRATLDVGFAALAGLGVLVAAIVIFSGAPAPPSPELATLAICAACANGAFDLSTAFARARFLDAAYGRLIIVKNLLSFALTIGGAWYFGSAVAALAGLIVSAAGSVVLAGAPLRDPAARPGLARRATAGMFATYALPIVAANFMYQSIPMLNRWLAAHEHDYAQAGQLALAFEIGLRVVGVIGSGLDVILFQLAVLREKTEGAESARAQVGRNGAIVLAIVLPVALGAFAVLPSFQALVVPEAYRGPFAHYFGLMTPALIAFALANYAVNPAFQIEQRTLPLVIAALVALIADFAAIALLPHGADATVYAMAQSAASIAGLLALLVGAARIKGVWPRARDILGACAAAAFMLACVWPLRAASPGLLTLILQAGLGAAAYAGVIAALDVAQLRTLVLRKLRKQG
ncbi:MAG: lipopolysaccharide biosynthesis protein [Hyphomicrobiales bacterium]|nr:lipopolysaccharide biosynthesis protein [Hyphomicrobiales bacterium]